MTTQLVKLELIQDNPYQPRTTDDPEHIKKLALSIAADSLLQIPQARNHQVDGSFQLAFGHSRRKAFEWLRDTFPTSEGLPDRYEHYTCMPLEIVELTDEQMYRYAITENIQRKDLSPIEEAQAMIRYRDEFKKNSDEIGELFAKTGSTVRGLIRLLDLPAVVQEKIASGEITQGAARKLLTIAKVDKDLVEAAAEEMAAGEDPDDVVEMQIRGAENVVEMWPSYKRDEKPRAGYGLWLLSTEPKNFPMKHMPTLYAKDAAKILGAENEHNNYERWIAGLAGAPVRGVDGILEGLQPGETVAEHFIKQGAPEDQIERLAHLINPPGCNDCPFHAVIDKSHYCAFKACHRRKVNAWIAKDLEKLSKEMGIAIYDPAADGKDFVPVSEYSYQEDYKKQQKMVEAKDPTLRLAIQKEEYNNHSFTNSQFVRVIIIGEGAKEAKEKKAQAKAKEQDANKQRERQWELEGKRRAASIKFEEQICHPLFAEAFKDWTNLPVMCALVGAEPPKESTKKADVLYGVRLQLAEKAIDNSRRNWVIQTKGPTAVAKHLQGVATSWGLKLPADFLQIAEGFEPVAAETARKNGKAKK